MRRVLFAVFLVMACATGAAAGPLEDAFSAYQRGDHTRAAQLFRPLAEQGDTSAQFLLGWMYDKGQGVPQNYQEAVKWYRKVADHGDAEAQFCLGYLYHHGLGVPEDYQEALKWYQRAAKQGDTSAQFNLGVMYNNGQGVPQDFILAHMWINVAAAASSGNDGKAAIKNRDIVASKMTASQIEKAQEMARRCQESKFKECD